MNIVITGASKGIGKAIAILFAQKGFKMAVCSRHEKNLQELKNEIHTINPAIEVYIKSCDVSDKKKVIEFGRFCLDNLGTIDILVNNAGVFLPGNIFEEPDGLLETLIETNLYSAYHLTRVIVPSMIKNNRGHVFNMCSVASINAYDLGGSYAISKYALLGFSKNLRNELKKTGIRVTSILPGATFTPSWGNIDLPEDRFIKDSDIAQLILNAFEISDRAVVEEIVIRPQLGDI